MTRRSLGFQHSQGIAKINAATAKSGYQTGREGLWLPSIEMAQPDLDGLKSELTTRADEALRPYRGVARDLARLYMGARVMRTTGCIVPSERRKPLSDERHGELLWRAMAHETGRDVLSPVASKHDLRLCECDECLNPRHYDIVQGLHNRQRLLLPDYRCYQTRPNGWIETPWGDVLPPVETSRRRLIDLQQRCPPHVDEGPLTLSGISKIGFDFTTGCWPVSTYYARLRGEDENSWRADGYGRIGINALLRTSLGLPARKTAQPPAHRVIWMIETGHPLPYDTDGNPLTVLNHMCGFKRCCNPLHLEEISQIENVQHGKRMEAATRLVGMGIWGQATLL